jgi:arylsulfatase
MKLRKSAGALLVPLALGTAGLGAVNCHAASTKPNFINIILDDLGFSDLGAFGSEISTPNLDTLANDGIIMTNFYAAPTSTPGRGMLFTGKSSHASGVGIMASMAPEGDQIGKPEYEGRLSLDALPFPELLQQNGYYTMLTGKWDLSEKAGVTEQDAADMATHDPYNRGFSVTKAALILGGGNHYSTDSTTTPQYQPWELFTGSSTNKDWVYTENGEGISAFPEEFFSTDYYTKSAVEMLDQWKDNEPDKPFYLCVSYTAPHNPLQTPPPMTAEESEPYQGFETYIQKYSVGWETIRAERFAKQKDLGFWPQDAVLPDIPGRKWADVPTGTDIITNPAKTSSGNIYGGQDYSAKEMAVYAAMIENLDLRIGELIAHLKAIGAYENTLITIHGDNGAASQVYSNVDSTDNSYNNIGNRDSYTSLDAEWAITSNTPFTNMKVSQREGGWHTAAIIHYPKWKKAKGMKADMVSSVTDFAPMMLDMAGISYPTTYNGKENPPMFGIPALQEKHPAIVPLNKQFLLIGSNGVKENTADRYVAFEMLGAIGLRHGDWKLVKEQCDLDPELFNLAEDPFEINDLSGTYPDKMAEMKDLYYTYAEENNIIQRIKHIFGFDCKPL